MKLIVFMILVLFGAGFLTAICLVLGPVVAVLLFSFYFIKMVFRFILFLKKKNKAVSIVGSEYVQLKKVS